MMIYSEVEILRYVENSLTEKQRIAFEQKMAEDSELKQLVRDMKASVLPYEAAMTDQYSSKAPESLYDFLDDVGRAVQEPDASTQSPKKAQKPWFSRLAVAASVASVLFLSGFMTSTFFNQPAEQNLLSVYEVPAELYESMVIYQALYSRKTVEAASQLPEDTDSLMAEFNRDNELELSVPDLSRHGYKFRRVQQLAYNDRPILQFIYQDKAGEPVAVCVTPANTGNMPNAPHMTAEFAGMNTVFWGNSGSAYMLISKEPQDKLNNMAIDLRMQQSS